MVHNVSKDGTYLSLAAAVSSYQPRGSRGCRQAASSVCSSAPPLWSSVEPTLKAKPAGGHQRGTCIDIDSNVKMPFSLDCIYKGHIWQCSVVLFDKEEGWVRQTAAAFDLVFLGLGAHHFRSGGGSGLPLFQALLSIAQPTLELLCAFPGFLPELQRGLLAV